MASTYVNDLRLNEMATGDQSGSWGTVTNTNLELIAEAFSYGTEAITTNADTHTTTIADGGTDPGRSMFLKYTGTLDSACTITIGPNTVSKLWFIENATSGSQNIIIKQGSGATVTIASGKTKVIYSDGVGSGAKMVDAFAALDVGALSGTSATFDGGVDIDNINIDGTTIALSSGDLTLDVAGDIILNADGGDWKFQDGTTGILELQNDGNGNAVLITTTSDKDIRFLGNDGGSTITALTLDMSEAGAATFNSTIAAGAATFTTADNTNQLTLVSTDADANAGPNLNLRRNSASPADGDLTGQLTFTNNNDAGEGTDYVTIHALSADVSNGSEDAAFYIKTMSAGTLRQRISLTDTATVFNEDSIDLDFRVESDNATHALFVQGSDGNVGIGTSSITSFSNTPNLTVGGSSGGMLTNQVNGTDGMRLYSNSSGTVLNETRNLSLQFATNNTERMRISGSGEILIGKTSAASSTVGAQIIAGGISQFGRSGAEALRLTRTTNDGNILEFQKNDTLVGFIGTVSDSLYIGTPYSNDSALRFSTNTIHPCDTAGAPRDNAIQLGYSSARFSAVYATNYYGSGANLTGVGGSTDYGAVGTYIAAYRAHVNDQTTYVQPGQTFSGTGFRKVDGGGGLQCDMDCAQTTADSQANNQSGTWRAMSSARYNGVYNNAMMVPSALYVRIS